MSIREARARTDVYKRQLLQIGAVTRTTADRIAESLYTNDVKKLQSAIAEYMDKSISFYDAGAEGFYHGLVLGLIALLDQQYKITSNREFGEGRYDISPVSYTHLLYDFVGKNVSVQKLENGNCRAVFYKMNSVTLLGWFMKYMDKFMAVSYTHLEVCA